MRYFVIFLLLLTHDVFAENLRPNILLLVAEDLSPRIGSFGDKVAHTPNIDSLAQKGVRFSNVYTTAGVCAPSRAALITGQHQIAFGAQHMRTSTYKDRAADGSIIAASYYAQPEKGLRAFPELLRQQGYYTFTDHKLDYQFSGINAGSGPFTIWDDEGANTHWRNGPSNKPFFGLINFMETHESGVMRANGSAHSKAHQQTQKWRKAAGIVSARLTKPENVKIAAYYPDVPEVRQDLARHYDNIRAMDARVGKILNELEADGLLDNTIILWTTDHGDGLPRAKRELFDSGINVPMVLSIPAKIANIGRWGSHNNQMISMVDFAPTLLALAGVKPRPYHQGINFLKQNRQYIVASRDRIDEVRDRQRAIRDDRYKYIRSWKPEIPGGHLLAYRDNLDMVRAMRSLYKQGKLNSVQSLWFQGPGKEQLYDTRNDPEELTNLANEPKMEIIKKRLSNALDKRLNEIGDTSDTPENAMRKSFMVGGSIPVTPTPSVKIVKGSITIQSHVDASIGYRTPGGRWRLYTEPMPQTNSAIEIKAVRYGWQESAIVKLN